MEKENKSFKLGIADSYIKQRSSGREATEKNTLLPK